MTNKERLEMATDKILTLIKGALYDHVTFQVIEMPDGRTMFAICFDTKVWNFNGSRLILKPTEQPKEQEKEKQD